MASTAARGDISDFERGVIVWARLAGASVEKKTAQHADGSRATVSKVTSAWNSEGIDVGKRRELKRPNRSHKMQRERVLTV